MERKQISNKTLLAVVEMIVRKTGDNMTRDGRGAFVTTSEAIGAMVEKMWTVTKANDEGDANAIAEAFLDVASICSFAVASMVVEDDDSVPTKPMDGVKDAPVDPEIARQLAHKKMIERTTASGIIIATEMPQ